MARSRADWLLEKSVSAMVAAIGVYNKPDALYREESFSILALNAWELLVKARILAMKNNKPNELYVYEKRNRRDGTRSNRHYIKRNRVNNPMTIGLRNAIFKIENEGLGKVDCAIKANLDALTEIRDNAIHLINIGPGLSKEVQEVGAATLQNFVHLVKEWFDHDLSRYNFYIMPLSFFHSDETMTAIDLNPGEMNVARYLTSLYRNQNSGSESSDYAVTLEINVKLKRSLSPIAAKLAMGNNPNAVPITLTEEDLQDLYPWDYEQLTARLRDRYSNFKQNGDYHSLRKSLTEDKRYVHSRFLDPGNPKSSKKQFYSPNILNEFDKHYNRS